MSIIRTELDAMLDRVREDKVDPTGKNRNTVAYDCWRMFEDLAVRYKEEFAMRDRYKQRSNNWRDKALELSSRLIEWQPIETAPRDGTPILVYRYCDPWHVIGWATWADVCGISGWIARGFTETPGVLGLGNPTHWMPLPAAPSQEAK